jgi:hypothetical protein
LIAQNTSNKHQSNKTTIIFTIGFSVGEGTLSLHHLIAQNIPNKHQSNKTTITKINY